MKLILATFVFFLALGLTYQVSASDNNETCTAGTNENCAQSKSESNGANHGVQQSAHDQGGEHGARNELSKKMNSLFPQKVKDPTQSTRPLQVKLQSPKFLETVTAPTAKLTWEAGEGATSYHVQVATDPNFKWLIANDYWVKTNAFDATKLEAGKRYFWRVASVKEGNISMHTKTLFVSSAFDTK